MITTRNTFHSTPRIVKVRPEYVMSTNVPRMYSGSSGTMTPFSTLSMTPEKSFMTPYSALPLSFFMADRHRPRIKARTTADSVSISGGIDTLKNGTTELSAVA